MKYKKFKKLYPKHGLNYICRALNINSDKYYEFVGRFWEGK